MTEWKRFFRGLLEIGSTLAAENCEPKKKDRTFLRPAFHSVASTVFALGNFNGRPSSETARRSNDR
jgi:hypothetical protein